MYKLVNGLWMFQVMPGLFLDRFDGFTWLFMKTGIHQWLIFNPEGWATADALFYSLPLIYYLSHNVFKTGSTLVSILMLVVNWLYIQCYTLYPTNSIEANTAWLLFPIIFLASDPKTFRLLAEGLRYFFLFFFASAGIWKIVNGGIFNTEQMTGVLLYQHADLLSNSPEYWQTRFIYWLIQYPSAGYILYLGATILELTFVIGFFTRKFDNFLVFLFIVFLVFDHLVMRIPYYEVLPFLVMLRLPTMRQDLLFSAVPLQSHSQN